MKNKFNLFNFYFTSLMLLLCFLVLPSSLYARSCGIYMGKKIVTYGNLSCSKAKAVYKSFNKGHIPKGWTCGRSVGGCGKIKTKQGFYFSSIGSAMKK